jgi:hypothetical protein
MTAKSILIAAIIFLSAGSTLYAQNASPPVSPVRLIFLHHSTGENWLADDNGGLGIALRNNNYFASDTNYGWGPDSIGDTTDIGNWWTWFRGPRSDTYMAAVYAEEGQNCSYSRLDSNPGGPNEIVMFKSCFPNSALRGSASAPIPAIDANPLKGQGSGSDDHTISNAKGIYIELLEYFREHQEKLFVVIAAPPLSDGTYAGNARLFNQWLAEEWLAGYPYRNVFVFDFYNVLTSNGGSAGRNDLDQEGGNHHRLWNGAIQHQVAVSSNTLAYPSGDDHPSRAGNKKATAEYLPLLNIAYHAWKDGDIPPPGGSSSSSASSAPGNGSSDTSPPVVAAKAVRGYAWSKVRLVYQLSDDSGTTKETIRILKRANLVKSIERKFAQIPAGGTRSVTWNAKKMKRGSYTYCVTAQDQAGNQSGESCAGVKLR